MDSNKSFIMMVVVGILFVGYVWIVQPKLAKKVVPYEEKKEEVITPQDTMSQDADDNKSIILPEGNSAFQIVEQPQEKKYDLTYENKNIKVVFDPHDAKIKHAYVKDTFLSRKEVRSYDLVSPRRENEGAMILKFGSWDNDKTISSLTNGNNLFQYERNGDVFTFKCELKKNGDGLVYTIVKRYEFVKGENIFKLDIEIFNSQNKPIVFDNSDIAYSIGWGPLLGVDSRIKGKDKGQINIFSYFDGKNLKKITDIDKMFKNTNGFSMLSKEAGSTWIANNGQYFAALIYPDNQNYKYFFDCREKDDKNYYSGFSRYTNKAKIESTFYVYIGPKISSVLKKADKAMKDNFNLPDVKIAKLDEVIIFYIGNGISYLLELIYKYVKNYGLAIIILTIIIKLLLAPLTHKSMVSQQKMSALQPKIKELQAKYKDKPEMLNKETMTLYKREGVNPFGGCLPMLLQMPILFAMFRLLTRMVALKGASFLWVNDLSLPDSIIDFGFTIPMINVSSLNILPILMVGVQVLSSMLMPDMQSNKQAKMMMWMMPIFFFFLFYNAASGLVLYWTIMNLLNLGQQVYTNYLKKKLSK